VPKSRARNESAFHPLDKNGFIPLYFQIQRALMEKIQSGELSEGDPLASEEELSRYYQVSRMTARQALHMRQRGMKPSSKLLEQTVVIPTEVLMQRLKLDGNDRVVHLRRLRIADGIPMAIEDSHIPLKQFPGLDRIDFARHSLYQTLRERYGVRVGYADEIIEALPATKEESELLTIPRKSSVLSITRVIMTTQETPVEAACSRYRGDRYRASIRVPMTAIE
jgi:GntR family transcriptional regulator